MDYMNFLDILIAIPLGYLIYKGYRRGLIFEMASLAGVVLGSVFAVHFANFFANLIGMGGNSAFLISFFILFVVVIVLALFLAKLVERFVKMVHAGFINNLAGALLGMLKGVCIVGVLIYYVAIIDLNEKVLTRDTKETSLLYRPVERAGKHLVGRMGYYIDQRKEMHERREGKC